MHARIITGTLQTILRVLGMGHDILTAVTAPRVHTQLLPDLVDIENHTYFADTPTVTINLPLSTRAFLAGHGHTLVPQGGFAVVQVITVDPDTSLIEAVSDPRKDGRPAGWS